MAFFSCAGKRENKLVECTALDLGSSSLQCRTAGHMIHILDYTVRHDETRLVGGAQTQRFSELNPAPFPETIANRNSVDVVSILTVY